MPNEFSDQMDTDDSDSRQTFIIASKQAGADIDLTIQAVGAALQSVPNASIIRADRDVGLVIVRAPAQEIDNLRANLGDSFMIEANASLRF